MRAKRLPSSPRIGSRRNPAATGPSIEPYQREDQGVAGLGRYIFMMGGEFNDEPAKLINRYDTHTKTWTHVEDYQLGWEKMRMIGYDGYLYIATGDGAGGNVCYRMDPDTYEAERLDRLPIRLAEAALAILDGQLVVIAGEEAASEELVGNVYILR